jgi:hypothetical protein
MYGRSRIAKEPDMAAADSSAGDGGKPPGKDPAAAALGRRGGRKGGKARAARLTAEQRREIARVAATARWARLRGEGHEAPARLASTPTAVAHATVALGGRQLRCFVLQDGRRLVAAGSAAIALAAGARSGAEDGSDAMPERLIPFHVPGRWQLERGLEIADFVALVMRACGQGDGRLAAMLAESAAEGLKAHIEAAREPLG